MKRENPSIFATAAASSSDAITDEIRELVGRRPVEVLREMLRTGLIARWNSDSSLTFLILAMREADASFVQLLLDAGVNPNATDSDGCTALMLAAEWGDKGTVSILLKAGANVNTADHQGRTALMRAANEWDLGIVRLLLKSGADVNASDKAGETALIKAADSWDPGVVHLLLEAGANRDAINCSGETATSRAKCRGRDAIVECLAGKAPSSRGSLTKRCDENQQAVTPDRSRELQWELEETLDDPRFDGIYPAVIRSISSTYWTPVAVARRAAKLLVTRPGHRILDIGCGPAKFCIVGATTTEGLFTGVERRKHLAALARRVVSEHGIRNVKIIHGNVTELRFEDFDGFYLFNPFEENLVRPQAPSASIARSWERYERYTLHVARQLERVQVETRVVTYGGLCHEVPGCYECKYSAFDGLLKLWIKTR